MSIFNPLGRYAPERSVRDDAALAHRLREPPPEGALWLVLAPRRAGKTWTLQAVGHHLGASARYLELRDASDRKAWTSKKSPPGGHWLLDELSGLTDATATPPARSKRQPSSGGERRLDRARTFLARCAELRRTGGTVVLALTPRELALLQRADAGNGRVSFKSLVPIPRLTEAQAEVLARTPVALEVLKALPAAWRRSPFLLELVFHVDEKERALGRPLAPEPLLRAVLESCEEQNHRYFQYVFGDALEDAHREVLRAVAWGGKAEPELLDLLEYAGLVEESVPGQHHLADPVLAASLSTLRIHHLSDVHVGPKSAKGFDAKVSGPISAAMDPGQIREEYQAHLKELKGRGLAPHLVVISGDLTEWATEAECQEARGWVDSLRTLLGEHPLLPADAPRILLVGGNHDVDWSRATDADPCARHQRFAQTFDGYPHPGLHVSKDAREVATVTLRELGVEFLLLGTSGLGGQLEQDVRGYHLQQALAKLPVTPSADERAKAEKEALTAARLDPGFVDTEDLKRLRTHHFQQPIRIAVLHHPPSPHATTEVALYAGLLNAGAVKLALMEKRFCLALCGHIHAGWLAEERWPGHSECTLRIAAAPSLGSREVQESHGFNVVEIRMDREPGRRETTHTLSVRRYARQGERSWAWDGRGELQPFKPES